MNVYRGDWLQHHIPYYHIQSLDIPQEPRPPKDKAAFLDATSANVPRRWQLTNTRFLLGPSGGFIDLLNQEFSSSGRFRAAVNFTGDQLPNGRLVNIRTNAEGPFALIEFT